MMKFTFSKTLLATMVFASLTACSSGGGGGGSSEPTTSSNSSESISIPNTENANNVKTNTSNNSANIKVPTTKANLNNITGTATYSGSFEPEQSAIRGGNGLYYKREGVFTLNADFDKQLVSGKAKLHGKGRITRSAEIDFEQTSLYLDKNKDIAFKGKATGVVNDVRVEFYGTRLVSSGVTGKYDGYFQGNNAQNVVLGFEVKSPDSLAGASGVGVRQ